MIPITLNGEARDVDAALTVTALVAGLAGGPRGVAVAINAEIVPRSAWSQTGLAAGDRVEILRAVQGG